MVVGLLMALVGLACLLDSAGVDVQWQLLPAVALVIVGLALVATLVWPAAGRGSLVGLGMVLLIAAVITSLSPARFAGPVGDRVVAPAVTDWPVDARLAAGNLTVDLTEHALPASGRLTADVGAGTVVVVLDSGSTGSVHVDATVGAGEVVVDGERVRNGTGIRWSTPQPIGDAVVLDLDVGLGKVEVRHE
jgi:hypothetical protein